MQKTLQMNQKSFKSAFLSGSYVINNTFMTKYIFDIISGWE